jgi:integrase
VDSKTLLLHVIGKGNKERALPLTEVMLEMLREVWKTHRSQRWLFPSRRIATPLSYASARNAFIKARSECGFDHRFRPHSLRHYPEFRIMPSSKLRPEKRRRFSVLISA